METPADPHVDIQLVLNPDSFQDAEALHQHMLYAASLWDWDATPAAMFWLEDKTLMVAVVEGEFKPQDWLPKLLEAIQVHAEQPVRGISLFVEGITRQIISKDGRELPLPAEQEEVRMVLTISGDFQRTSIKYRGVDTDEWEDSPSVVRNTAVGEVLHQLNERMRYTE